MRNDYAGRAPRPIPPEGELVIIDNLEHLKRKVADARQRGDRAAGEHAAALKRLRDEFGCATEAEGRKLLAKTEKEERKLAAEYAARLAEFESKYSSLLT